MQYIGFCVIACSSRQVRSFRYILKKTAPAKMCQRFIDRHAMQISSYGFQHFYLLSFFPKPYKNLLCKVFHQGSIGNQLVNSAANLGVMQIKYRLQRRLSSLLYGFE